ncbi:hypothetical protein PAXRUDRAFT_165290, partial [Paxillus rubicundulus Ve08.2h10]
FASQSCCFIDADQKGLYGQQAAWATNKYHRHWVLMPCYTPNTQILYLVIPAHSLFYFTHTNTIASLQNSIVLSFILL